MLWESNTVKAVNRSTIVSMSTNVRDTNKTDLADPELSHTKAPRRKASGQNVTVQILSSRAERQLSTTEVVYPDPTTAQMAFERERADNPLHRRAPTPHTSRRRSDSTASHRSHRSHRSGLSEDNDHTLGTDSDGATVGPWEPHFGSARGIGPAGEAIEVIGLGRKEPRHRKYAPHLLKPALRTGPSLERIHSPRRDPRASGDKPLPHRPASYIVPGADRGHTPSFVQVHQPSHVRSNSQPLLRSPLSSLSIDAPPSAPLFGRRHSRRELVSPADDLFTYLRIVDLPSWTAWQGDRYSNRPTSSLSFFSTRASKGHDSMPWAWHRRAEAAEDGRQGGRALMNWESTGRHGERKLLQWIDDNIPAEPIEPANRWGSQIFALPAPGFDTMEFFDEAADQADDSGLLSWLIGSVLQTSVSALHMLRYSSQTFTFHLIPSSSPTPYPSSQHALFHGIGTLALVNKANELDRAMILEIRPPSICSGGVMREFAKTGRSEGWWHLPSQYCVGDAGQANLLQAQVYDSCVQNGVFFFGVTNLKHWVFGHFNANYTKCWVGGVVERKMRDPNVMQCLTAWAIRAVDERPRRSDLSPNEGLPRFTSAHAEPEPPGSRSRRDRSGTRHREYEREREVDQPRYLDPVTSSESPVSPISPTSTSNMSNMSSTPNQVYQPYPQPNYPSQTNYPHSTYPSPMSSPMGDFGQYAPPGYYDLHPQMGSPPPPFSPGGRGYNTWSSGMQGSQGMQAMNGQGIPQRAFSPVQHGYGGSMGYFSGYGWPGMR